MTEALTNSLTEESLFELLSLECRIDTDGTVRYFNSNGESHRVYGASIEYSDGSRAWYQNGQLNRLDGPAFVGADGSCEWYINGKELTRAEWQQAVTSMRIA